MASVLRLDLPTRMLWVRLTVAVVFFMETLDGTVIATALPPIARTFRVSPDSLSLAMTSYLVAVAAFVPASAWLSERFGSKRLFLAAVGVFTLASLLCGISGSAVSFILLRTVQGIGGAMMVPVGRLVVLRGTPREQLTAAIATITWPALVGPILGPPLGGLVVTLMSWRWIFLFNLPIGLAAMVFAALFFGREPAQPVRRFDLAGFLMSASGLALVVFGLHLAAAAPGEGSVPGGYATICGCVAGGAAALLWAVRHMRRTAEPLVNLAALQLPSFRAATRGGSMFRIAIGALPFLLPAMFQDGFGQTALKAGWMLLIVFAGNLAMKPLTRPVLARFGFRDVLVGNGALNALLLAAIGLIGPNSPLWAVFGLLFLGGLSRSLQYTALNTLVFSEVAKPSLPSANTLFSAILQLSLGLGITLGALVLHGAGLVIAALGDPGVSGFAYRLAFLGMGLIALSSVFEFWRLEKNVGCGLT